MGGARLESRPLCKVKTNKTNTKQYHHSILPTFKAACPLAGNGEGAVHRLKETWEGKGKGERSGFFFNKYLIKTFNS